MSFGRKSLRRVVVDACDGPFGSGLKSEHYVDEGARVIRLGNLGSGDWLDSDAAFIDLAYWAMLRRHHAAAGDLIMAGLGDEAHPVGRACVLPDVGPALVKADCYRLRLDPLKADARFMALYLSSTAGGSEAQMLAEGSTRSRLTLSKGLSVQVPDIDVDTQRAIADYLDAETARIDALVERRVAVVDLLVERFDSDVFQQVTGGAVHGPRRPSGLEWVPEIPRDWGTPAVGANFQVQLGKMLNPDAKQGELRPYLRNLNVQWDSIDTADLEEMDFDQDERIRFELRDGDLLVCEGGEVGRAAVWHGEVPGCYYQKALHRVRPYRNDRTRFLMYALRAAAKRGVFANEGNTSTIVHLTAEKLRAHRLPWPSVAVQTEIVERLDQEKARFDRQRASLELQVSLLQERHLALITAAVTGQIEIPGVAA